jgi:hypothetical protein
MLRRLSIGIGVGLLLSLGIASTALADPSPNGPGQPGAPNTTCSTFTTTPGNSVNASGSVFNPNGTAGTVYAGNPGTASAAHAHSSAAVSQYDIACFQNTSH